MTIEASLPAWHRHAIAPLALAGGITLGLLPGLPGTLLGVVLLGAALTALLLHRLRHHVQMQARFCEQWPYVVAPLQAHPDPAAPELPAIDPADFDRRRRGVAMKAAVLRLALADGEEAGELELQLRDLMDRLSLHVRRETDLLARRGDARRRADVDAARVQLANAEYDFHRYCIGELTLPELVDRVTSSMLVAQAIQPGLARDASTPRQSAVDAR